MIVAMLAAITALTTASLLVLAGVPAESGDSAEQMMVYLSLVAFVMALIMTGTLALFFAGKGGKATEMGVLQTRIDGRMDDEVSEIELEFRALEMETEREEVR
ncbi:MAG: hypothetical protein JSV94_03165 [Methanobacteriota archaeon]|nr:MAG: hypothetical protein JSV94_03165 [Euryarchaeota archaeon]